MFHYQVLINVLEKYLHQAIEIPKCLLKVIPGHLLSMVYSPIILTFFFITERLLLLPRYSFCIYDFACKIVTV